MKCFYLFLIFCSVFAWGQEKTRPLKCHYKKLDGKSYSLPCTERPRGHNLPLNGVCFLKETSEVKDGVRVKKMIYGNYNPKPKKGPKFVEVRSCDEGFEYLTIREDIQIYGPKLYGQLPADGAPAVLFQKKIWLSATSKTLVTPSGYPSSKEPETCYLSQKKNGQSFKPVDCSADDGDDNQCFLLELQSTRKHQNLSLQGFWWVYSPKGAPEKYSVCLGGVKLKDITTPRTIKDVAATYQLSQNEGIKGCYMGDNYNRENLCFFDDVPPRFTNRVGTCRFMGGAWYRQKALIKDRKFNETARQNLGALIYANQHEACRSVKVEVFQNFNPDENKPNNHLLLDDENIKVCFTGSNYSSPLKCETEDEGGNISNAVQACRRMNGNWYIQSSNLSRAEVNSLKTVGYASSVKYPAKHKLCTAIQIQKVTTTSEN